LRPRVVSIRAVCEAAVLCLGLALGNLPTKGQSTSANYAFLLAAGFLCDSGDSTTCPAVVKSADGASYEMSGAGTFTSHSKSITAAGTFTHKSADGVVLATGVWVASELVSFDSSGIAPGVLNRESWALGPRQIGPSPFGPRGLGMFSGPMAEGGLAVLRIRLLPVLGFARNATLQVNCALGKVPTERAVEGIRLSFEKGGAEFDEEISGRAMFLMNRFGAAAAAKAQAPDAVTKSAPVDAQQ